MYPGTYAKEMPDKAAVIDAVTGKALTYRQLDEQSAQLARYLMSVGLQRGDTLAINLENRLEFFVATWAALLAQGPRSTPTLNDPGRHLRHFAGPGCLPRGREATFLPETVTRPERVNKDCRAAAAWGRTTEQPLVDRAPPGALNRQNLNV